MTESAIPNTKGAIYYDDKGGPPQIVQVPDLPAAEKFYAALAKAQAAMVPPTKDQKADAGGKYSYRYAGLPSVIEAVRGPLTNNGIAFVQHAGYDSAAQCVTVVTELAGHGYGIRSTLHMPSGQKPQEVGSALTYARRYGLQSMCGICPEDDDDAGKAQAAVEKRQQTDVDMRLKLAKSEFFALCKQAFALKIHDDNGEPIDVPSRPEHAQELINRLLGVVFEGSAIGSDEYLAASRDLRERIKITEKERAGA